MDSGFAGGNIVQVEDNEYISSSDKRTEYQKEGIDTTVGIDKRKINEERTPLRNESVQAESITSIHRTPTSHVGTSEHLSILKECNLNENLKLSDIKEIPREDSYIGKKNIRHSKK
ncbi:hypothetical protein JTB14_032025 [Gonioctena quinquepunctata]|nr:hypothetical protein JTB14_032025 [Gonioctena quinquepunctata]